MLDFRSTLTTLKPDSMGVEPSQTFTPLPLPKLREVWRSRVPRTALATASAASVCVKENLDTLLCDIEADVRRQVEDHRRELAETTSRGIAYLQHRMETIFEGPVGTDISEEFAAFLRDGEADPKAVARKATELARMEMEDRVVDVVLPLLVRFPDAEPKMVEVRGVGSVVRVSAGRHHYMIVKPIVTYNTGVSGIGSTIHELKLYTLKVGASPALSKSVDEAMASVGLTPLLYPRSYWDRDGCRFKRVKEGSIVYFVGAVGIVTGMTGLVLRVFTGAGDDVDVPQSHVDAILGEVNRPWDLDGKLTFVLYGETAAVPHLTELPRGFEPDSPEGFRAAFLKCGDVLKKQ